MNLPPAEDASIGQLTGARPLPDLVGWVRQGEQLFGTVLQTLQEYEQLRQSAKRLEQENRRLLAEMREIREELHDLRAERVEAAETLKAFAEHVTQLATLAIQRLGKRAG
jgi:septal ring factor EnvC (AmiA/AmiB activator)